MSTGLHSAIKMPETALPGWALIPPPSSESIFLTMVLMLIQLLGIIGVGKGTWQIIMFFKPNEPKAPPSLAKPLMMVIFGLFALVPARAYELALDTLRNIGWL